METAKKGLVLIVDDNPINTRLLFKFLTKAGLTVSSASDGFSAIEQVNTSPPDLILLDVMMPGIDGFQTCQRLKASPQTREIPVIFMTALTDTAHKVKAFELGAVDYISKPFQKEEILARINIHLEMRILNRKMAAQNLLLQQSQKDLEQRVEERTSELLQTVEHLQKTQMQLIQSEKMSSLGQLVAGVAHEINNPVNFICGNLVHAGQYIHNLLDLLHLYQHQFAEIPLEIQDKADEIDLDFVQEDLPKLFCSMQVGTDRIRNIVRSLRMFSRLDEAEQKLADLHEGLESTLIILGSRLKAQPNRAAIEVIRDYDDLPLVECYPGQINQVFINILSNAIDALEESVSAWSQRDDYLPTIWIRTKLKRDFPQNDRGEEPTGDVLAIEIADNGLGIPEEIQKCIFDPFFTTKPVGKGTGLGMSISYSIVVEQHQGKLICNSVPGKGTEFIIEIPIV
ncbi:response regulator [Oscillatoriales cyanobacterium LEGE 11467]|uniref:histidine kinase n=1 Tax=Zarconia navalis LEGE 11467 TaxID=1828826 RepID=A0A928W027_9CYAN|nr:response regulator [Zarconia navalis]MBE9042002.1 response regulator [Zarconia navalis LEGE 11467]